MLIVTIEFAKRQYKSRPHKSLFLKRNLSGFYFSVLTFNGVRSVRQNPLTMKLLNFDYHRVTPITQNDRKQQKADLDFYQTGLISLLNSLTFTTENLIISSK